MKVWIYPPCPEKLPEALKSRLPSLEIIVSEDEIPDADIVVGNPSTELLKRNAALKLIQLRSAGTGNFPSLIRERPEVRLCCATGAYGHAVAEHMFSALLTIMLCRASPSTKSIITFWFSAKVTASRVKYEDVTKQALLTLSAVCTPYNARTRSTLTLFVRAYRLHSI